MAGHTIPLWKATLRVLHCAGRCERQAECKVGIWSQTSVCRNFKAGFPQHLPVAFTRDAYHAPRGQQPACLL
jgi:hypothetical protein